MVTTKKQTASASNRSASSVPAKSKPSEKQNRQAAGSNNGAKSKAQPNLSPEQVAVELVKQIRNTIHKKYGVTIQRRDSRIGTKIGHAMREKLGLDVQAELNKRNGNGNGKKFDWQEWNNTIFPKLLGELKYDIEVVALAMSQLYDTIAENPQAAIADLIEFNAQSLKRRNELAKSSEEDTEELDDDELDDEDDEIDDILDEIDEDDDDDDDDELDDDDEDDFSLDEDEEFEEDDE
jgi:hypothetical protein